MLDQAVSEMKQDLVKMRQASAEVYSTQKMLETKYTQAQASAVCSALILICRVAIPSRLTDIVNSLSRSALLALAWWSYLSAP